GLEPVTTIVAETVEISTTADAGWCGRLYNLNLKTRSTPAAPRLCTTAERGSSTGRKGKCAPTCMRYTNTHTRHKAIGCCSNINVSIKSNFAIEELQYTRYRPETLIDN